MIELRELTNRGIDNFESYLVELDNSEKLDPPNLNDEPYSKVIDLEKRFYINEDKKFSSRLEIGSYLCQRLSLLGIDRDTILVKKTDMWNNVWSWLAYIWLNQFVNFKNGVYQVPARSHFIVSKDWGRFYRHFVATPYYIYSLHGDTNSRLFLECAPSIHNEFMEQIASRQWIITSKKLVELAHFLYWDNEKNRAKRGASGKEGGTARRFGTVINQFRLTYDIYMMELQEILSLLPSEFNEWKSISK